MSNYKYCTWLILLFLGVSFSAGAQNSSVFFDGTAPEEEWVDFFITNFKMEAAALNYAAAVNRESAGYSFRFIVEENMIEYDDGTKEPVPPGENKYILTIHFYRNADRTEIVSYGFPFTEPEDTLDFIQWLFIKSSVYILEDDPSLTSAPAPERGDDWQNKWLYLRTSLGFPITMYSLLEKDLHEGAGAVHDEGGEYWFDNKTIFLPSFTLGVEVQFLDWMSAEIHFQAGWKHLSNQDIMNLQAGLDLKFPLKVYPGVTFAPFLTVSMPIPSPLHGSELEIIYASPGFSFNEIAFGGGLQVGFKGGKLGSIFAEISYTYTPSAIAVNNPLGEGWQPESIHYRRSSLGLGIGYKFGFLDR